MTKAEYGQKILDLLKSTLEEGPGPHAVAMMTGAELARFIMNEAGANAPAALADVTEHMMAALREAEAADMTPDTSKMLFYPHDGELEGGGVFVDSSDDGHVYLLVKGRYTRVELAAPTQAPSLPACDQPTMQP